MKTTHTRLLAAATATLLAFTGSGALAHATDNPTPDSPSTATSPFAKDADQLSWGHKDLPTASQIRKEMKQGKRPRCTVKFINNQGVADCTNTTTTHYFAAVTTTCPGHDKNGIPIAKPASTSFAIPAGRTAHATVSCPKGDKAQGVSLTGPVTKQEAELIQKNTLEFTVKNFL